MSNASCPDINSRSCLVELPEEGVAFTVRQEFHVIAAAPPNFALTNKSNMTEIQCNVSAGGAFPNRAYRDKTNVRIPVAILPSVWTFLEGIITESLAEAGLFSLNNAPLFNASLDKTVCEAADSKKLTWDSQTLHSTCINVLEEKVLDALSSPSVPSLELTVGSSTHVLLVTRGAPFSISGVSVAFRRNDGGFISVKPNWVSPTGSFASFTSPNVTSICGPSVIQCYSQILLSTDWGTTRDALLSAANLEWSTDIPLQLSTAYPPLVPRYPFDRDIINETSRHTIMGSAGVFDDLARYSFFGSDFNDGASFNGTIHSGPYILFVSGVCTDLTLSSRAKNYTFVKLLADAALTGGVWGEAADCKLCSSVKTNGADCPGGKSLLPKEGFWAPSPSSPLTSIIMCDAPAAARCPGWRRICDKADTLTSCEEKLKSTGGCSSGYTGIACRQCAFPLYFASYNLKDELSCKPCQSFAQTVDSFKYPSAILGFLLVCIGALIYFTRRFLECSTLKAALAASELGAWVWMALQSTGAILRVTQKFAPKELRFFFVMLTSLQIVGVTDALPCPPWPFTDTWAAVVASALLLFTGAVALIVSMRAERMRSTSDDPLLQLPRASRAFSVLQFACNSIFILYGPIASALSNSLFCSGQKSSELSVYLSLNQDGSSLLSLHGSNPTFAAAIAAANLTKDTAYTLLTDVVRNPSSLSKFPQLDPTQVESILKTTVDYRTVASAPLIVCFEGAHKAAWWAAVITSVVVLVGFAVLGLWVSIDLAVLSGVASEVRECFVRKSCSFRQQLRRTWSFRLREARGQPPHGAFAVENPLNAHRELLESPIPTSPPAEKLSARTLLASSLFTKSRKDPGSARAVLSAALAFEGIREGAESFTFIILGALGIFTFVASSALRETNSEKFSLMMTSSGILALILAMLAHYWKPYNSFMVWKNDGLTWLYILSFASSGLSVYMFVKADKNVDEADQIPSLSSGEPLPLLILLTIVVIFCIFVFIAKQWLFVTRRVLGEKKRLRDFEVASEKRIASAQACVVAVESVITNMGPLSLDTVIFERQQAQERAAYERRMETESVVSSAAEFIMNEIFSTIDKIHFSARTAVFVGAAALVRQSALRLIQGAAREIGPGAGQRISDTVWKANRLEHFARVLESVAEIIDEVDDSTMKNVGACFIAASGILEEIADNGPLGASDFHLRNYAAQIRDVVRAKRWPSNALAIPEWRARLFGDADFFRLVFPLIEPPLFPSHASAMPEAVRLAFERAELERLIALKESEVEAAVARRAAELAAREAEVAAHEAARVRLRHYLEAASARELQEAAVRRETSRSASIAMAPTRSLTIHHETGHLGWADFEKLAGINAPHSQ